MIYLTIKHPKLVAITQVRLLCDFLLLRLKFQIIQGLIETTRSSLIGIILSKVYMLFVQIEPNLRFKYFLNFFYKFVHNEHFSNLISLLVLQFVGRGCVVWISAIASLITYVLR
jgi:hypothetical protein